uniref:Uncharacterized protein n=1 Tax=Acrobeloides nanus TaxID=290746 RepID=A0A914DRC5_9BILA
MDHVEVFINEANKACNMDHCPTCWNNNYTLADLAQVVLQYQQAEKSLEQSGYFDTTDDFTLVTQPMFVNVTTPPLNTNGTYNKEFFSADCFHWSQYGHAIIASYLWQNMLQPIGSKNHQANLSAPALPLSCPDSSCPFIRTTKNSANCQQYYTEPAW